MTKSVKSILIIALIAAIAFIVYKHYKSKKQTLDEVNNEIDSIVSRTNGYRNKLADLADPANLDKISYVELNKISDQNKKDMSRLIVLSEKKKVLLNKK